MEKNYGRIGPKVLLGYVILIIIAVSSLAYIYNVVKQIAAEEDINSVPRQKIYLVTNTKALLYESETMGQLLEMPDEEYTHFNETLDQARENMDSLRLIVTDSLQLLKIDTIDMLIEQKRVNTNDLLMTWKQVNTDLYAKNIEKAMAIEKPPVVEAEVKEQVTNQQDTVVVAGKKRTFFRRLADAFVPDKADTSIVVSANQQVQKDTLLNVYDPNAAINTTLKNIRTAVAKEQRQLQELLINRSALLRYDNSLINTKINQILRDMEEEEMNASLSRIEKRQDLLQGTSYLISGIALLSLIVTIFFLFFIARDLSKSKYYRKQLEKAKDYAENLLHSRERLMMTISHDIRAPLSSIIGYIELLLRTRPTKQQQTYLKNMNGSSNHILLLVNDLLDFERLESGQMEIHKIPLRVSDLFNEIYESFKPQASTKLDFVLEINEGSDKVYLGDIVRIRQVVGNLINNALKFTHEGSVRLLVDCSHMAQEVEESGLQGVSELKVTVSDTGVGIAEEEQGKIFGEFTRLSGTEKTEGFGLGLSITHKLISLMGGKISLESTIGEGSDFTITLPLPLAENQLLEDTHVEDVDSSGFEGQSITCLLVDDDLLQLALMEEILTRNHIHVISCTNPQAVVDLLRETPVDVVITDINMPGMDGYALLEAIRSSDLSVAGVLPVIVLSAAIDKDHKHYLKVGFAGALSKPFTANQVISLLNELLLKELEVKQELDISTFTAFTEGDKEDSDKLLRTFSTETNRNLGLLRKTLESGDREEASAICHKLVPLFSMLGASTLVQQLKILDRNDKELTDSGWKSLLTEVINQATSIVQQIESSMS